uniref:Mu-like prophage I protein n=1 Tax=Candidatus Kentrum sp. LPFa TaxID=2126335 RepID=A0A450WD57_9GAMM|nr:MAG: hypothetical protein BECKLPF1236B_GA0070989_10712 [Candidatus Kentron sp. LPFa]
MKKQLHIFRAGRHATDAGEAIEFSESDIQATAAAYDPGRHEAPVVIGHPRSDSPAQGWVSSLSASPRGLHASLRDVSPEFAERVDRREYAKVSSKFYRPEDPNNPTPGVWGLRHVGFVPIPSLKGLEDPAFAEEDGCVVFSENLAPDDAPESDPETGADPSRTQTQPETKPASEEEKDTVTEQEKAALEAEKARIIQEKEALKAENARLKREAETAEAERTARAQAARHEANAAFAEDLLKEGRLAPKYKEVLVSTLDALGEPDGEGAPAQFGEGEDRRPLVKAVREMLADGKEVVQFGEAATRDKGAGRKEENPLVADAERRAGK